MAGSYKPLSIPGVISGITMVFVPALTTFVISDLLGGGKILLIGNVIEQSFKQNSKTCLIDLFLAQDHCKWIRKNQTYQCTQK